MGYMACLAASESETSQGNVGAGAGATVGKWGGFDHLMKGGFGLASLSERDLTVAAAAVVNPVGDVVEDNGAILAGAVEEDGRWKADSDPLRRFPERPPAALGMNTTLVAILTNGQMDKAQACRLAERAHDGIAIAVRPAHTTHDGDVAFGLSSGSIDASFDLVCNMAVLATTVAIRNAVRHARTVGGARGLAG
jgi:L-aminopeptidase/D-esterase-like protein